MKCGSFRSLLSFSAIWGTGSRSGWLDLTKEPMIVGWQFHCRSALMATRTDRSTQRAIQEFKLPKDIQCIAAPTPYVITPQVFLVWCHSAFVREQMAKGY
jgi:hypothetical protein